MHIIYKLQSPIIGKVIKRPSKIIKSPYVADVTVDVDNVDNVDNDDINTELAHAPALGCCGLSEAGCDVIMEKIENEDKKCKYRIVLSIISSSIIVGIYPKYAENMVERALQMNLLSKLQNVTKYRREFTIHTDNVHSKFDFVGLDHEKRPFIMEVKNVPLADYEDLTYKERKVRPNYKERDERDEYTKVAYFPDGYRKHVNDTVSPRALKHIKELINIKKTSITRCIMCYVIQRNDVNCFQPSVIDPEYRAAFYEAIEAGVEIITMVVKWTMEGNAYFVTDELPLLGI